MVESLKGYSFEEILEQVPEWNFDGSSTHQATGDNSEVILKPCRIYFDPFSPAFLHGTIDNQHVHLATSSDQSGYPIPARYLVLCDTWLPDGTPHQTNTRQAANLIFSQQKTELKPWFGMEQEFFMINSILNEPLGYKKTGKQGQYYCSVGASNCFGRDIATACLDNCLKAGLNITGMNFEVAPGQCELQLREEGIKAADDLLILRYILIRTAEPHGVDIDFSSKPLKGDWNGSGCHVNFSTLPMRQEGGYKIITDAIHKLSLRHQEHLDVYGDDNSERLTGEHETSSMDKFSYGVANRGCSVRIPNQTIADNCGYFEDRRPSSSMDPYKVLSILFQTTSL